MVPAQNTATSSGTQPRRHMPIWGVEVQLHAVLTSALDWYEQLQAPTALPTGKIRRYPQNTTLEGAPRPESRDRRLMEEEIPFVLSQE
jgi:hypothetical protein